MSAAVSTAKSSRVKPPGDGGPQGCRFHEEPVAGFLQGPAGPAAGVGGVAQDVQAAGLLAQ
ncbi:hypothetical protein [Streptomyces sp. NBC_00203]|uniref:hypothetical protein n=1 Tax=Streptomyces sp. NBC_00203 TaxID=2975680 RepID=UPI003252D50A